MRVCTHCRVEKPESEFSTQKSKNKNTGLCKICNLERTNLYVARNKEKIKKYKGKYYKENKDKINMRNNKYYKDTAEVRIKYAKEYRVENKKKTKAQDRVRSAVRRGLLKKEPCLACQVQDKKINNNNIDGHHTDYDRPLNVVWLCRKHHLQVHKLMNNNNL